MKILTLPVAKPAFDMLADQNPETRKMEEYRAMIEFWFTRLLKQVDNHYVGSKHFDLVKFTNGYGNKVPRVFREWKGLTICKPNPLWVPPGFLNLEDDYFAIQLGDIVLETPELLTP